jgi:hypothetical protein
MHRRNILRLSPASGLSAVIWITLLRKRHTTPVAIRTTAWHTPYNLMSGDVWYLFLFSSRYSKKIYLGTITPLLFPSGNLRLSFTKSLTIMQTNCRGHNFAPWIPALVKRLFGLLHKYLAVIVTARAVFRTALVQEIAFLNLSHSLKLIRSQTNRFCNL